MTGAPRKPPTGSMQIWPASDDRLVETREGLAHMFGLTFDKVIIIAIVAAFLLGPERIPHYAAMLGRFVRKAKEMTAGAKERLRDEMGPEFDEVDWKKLNPRQYDPRRIIRDALLDDEPTVSRPVRPVASTAHDEPANHSSATS